MPNLTIKELQRRIVWFAVGIVLATGIAVAISVLVPMQREMRAAANAYIAHQLNIEQLAVNQYLSRLGDIGRQIVSRTQIRKRLIAYNQGKVTYDDVRSFSDPRLGDALKEAGDAMGMVRLDQKHQAVSIVGTAPPETVWEVAVEGGDYPFLIGPAQMQNGLVTYAVTPIFDKNGGRHGTDIVMFHLGGLAAILTGTESGENHATSFSVLTEGPHIEAAAFRAVSGDEGMQFVPLPLPWATDEEVRASRRGVVLAAGQDGVERALISVSLDKTGWVLLKLEQTDTLYADARQSLHQAVAVIASMIAVGALAVSFMLRSTTGQVLVTAQELQRQVEERQRAQLQIMQAKEEAEVANKAKSDFLASMSHELRTPLNAVLGFGQLLKLDASAPLSDKQQEHIQSILDGGEHLLELVNQLLDLAKIEANRAPMHLEAVDVQSSIAECVELTKPMEHVHNVTVVNELADMPSVELRTDPLRFKQIMINLLSNAVKYNKAGGTVTVSGHLVDNDFYHIDVTDTGRGIAEKDWANVFHMFHRLGEDPALAREGTGIGLAVTKLLVEHLAGRIGFDSEVGAGSRFWFELPLVTNFDALIWEDALLVGVDPLDTDHKRLVYLVNAINQQNLDEPRLDFLLMELLNDIQQHFSREEAVMEACEYPDLDHHRALHRDILQRVQDLEQQWREQRDLALLANLRALLREFWVDHILEEDVKLNHYTQGKEDKIRKALDTTRPLSNPVF